MKKGIKYQSQPPPEDPVVIRPTETARVSIRAVANVIAKSSAPGTRNAVRILGKEVTEELVHKVNAAVEWYKVRT